jgi:NAD(P)-dependent dehydrogenase (short-subunit alcohol dehydrogenase family)
MDNLTSPLISRLGLRQDALQGETAIVTGAGGGIGLETARALLWLGANVVIAEINAQAGARAASELAAEFGAGRVLFVPTDVGEESSVQELAGQATRAFGRVDVVINNATIAVLGAVKDLPIEKWDASYRVNLRGPVLMARAFLPGMIGRRHGVFACVSSTGTAFLGGYETFKAAQVHLGSTLDAELEGTGVSVYTIGPGLVRTETASRAVEKLAPLMGMTVDEFFTMNQHMVLSAEEAGAGFAVSVVFAEKFRGQEISSIQALKAADINYGAITRPGKALWDGAAPAEEPEAGHAADHGLHPVEEDGASRPGEGDRRQQALAACQAVHATLAEQSAGWKQRSLFERQWVIRDFRKTAGMPVEDWLSALADLEDCLGGPGPVSPPPLGKLAGYYEHLAELAKGFEKDPAKLKDSLLHVYGWKEEVDRLEQLLA